MHGFRIMSVRAYGFSRLISNILKFRLLLVILIGASAAVEEDSTKTYVTLAVLRSDLLNFELVVL